MKPVGVGRGDRGSVLLVVIIAVVAVATASWAHLIVGQARLRRMVAQAESEQSFALAESAVHSVTALLNAKAFGATSLLDWSTDGVDNDGDGDVDEGDEAVAARLALWESDGLDNDGDGSIDEADEKVAVVEALASLGRTTRRIRAWLVKNDAVLPDPPGAVYLNDPNAEIRFSGNAFRIDGNDHRASGGLSGLLGLHGIAVNGSVAALKSQLSGRVLSNITGVGGSGSMQSWAPNDPLFIRALVDALAPLAHTTFADSSGMFTGSLGSWDPRDLRITYSKGDLKVSGGSQGAGILLVDGDLEITGGWEYSGYVFVTGRTVFKGGGGGKRLKGALFVGGDVVHGNSWWMESLWVTGTVDILYSREVLDAVRATLDRYVLVATMEPTSPPTATQKGGSLFTASPGSLLDHLLYSP